MWNIYIISKYKKNQIENITVNLTVVAFLSKTCLQLNAFDSQNLMILVYGDENF